MFVNILLMLVILILEDALNSRRSCNISTHIASMFSGTTDFRRPSQLVAEVLMVTMELTIPAFHSGRGWGFIAKSGSKFIHAHLSR